MPEIIWEGVSARRANTRGLHTRDLSLVLFGELGEREDFFSSMLLEVAFVK